MLLVNFERKAKRPQPARNAWSVAFCLQRLLVTPPEPLVAIRHRGRDAPPRHGRLVIGHVVARHLRLYRFAPTYASMRSRLTRLHRLLAAGD